MGVVALLDPTREEEDGWFGEGSAFDSGEDLAAALLELAGVPARRPAAPAAAEETDDRGRGRDLIFELLRPFHPEPGSDDPTPSARTWSAPNQPLTWSVREPGSVSLPARQPGKTGWSIRSSVQVLQRTEEVLQKLREEAVNDALAAAGRAVRSVR